MTTTATLQATRFGAALGAVVEGVDFRAPVSPETAAELRALLDEHQVLFFHDQHLDAVQQVAVARVFGVPGGPEPFRTLDGDACDPISVQTRDPEHPPFTDQWHTDISFSPTPPITGTLCAERVPAVGGDTAWCSLYRLYESLSEPMQQLCEQLQGEHTWEAMRGPFVVPRGPEYLAKADAFLPPQLHPLVRTHPRTGRKYVYLGGARGTWMKRIVGLHPREADMLLDYLQRQLDNLEFQVRWHWTIGDLAIWEQPTTNHMGMGDHFEYDPYRVVRSVWSYADAPTPFMPDTPPGMPGDR